MKKKLAIIGTVGVPARYGGFETLADHLVRNLGEEYDITVYCSGKKYKKEQRQKTYLQAKLKYIPLEANGMQSIPYDTLSILDAVRYADVLLVLGVAGAWILPFVKLFTSKKIILSIDGIEWKRDKWGRFAKWYLWWAEKVGVRFSHADISDNESIQDYTAYRYGSLSHIIEYGADHTLKVKPAHEDFTEFPFLGKPYAFKVCRIEPENNIHVVLEAFAKMNKYTLVMIGNWKQNEYGRKLLAKYKDYTNLHLLPPVYDQRKLDLIRGNAYVYIHGHSAGGTNPSLVEAMYLGLPVIAYSVSYNRTTTENKAFYFQNAEELIAIVEKTRLADFRTQAEVMKEIALRRYTWKTVAEKYGHLVKTVLESAGKKRVAPAVKELSDKDLIEQGVAHLPHSYLFFEKR